MCLGWWMDGTETVGALPWVSTSSRICISSFLPSNLCSHCKRITVSALSSLLKVKLRQINQGPYNPALRRSFVSALEGGEGAIAQQDLLEASQFYRFLPGRHWDAFRIDEPMDPNEYMSMKTASHWLKSRLCYTPWQKFPWLQYTRFN